MKKVIVFCPLNETELIMKAMFDAGAGRIGNYDQCCFQTQGVGQFRPLEGSDAFVGSCNKLEYVDEIKLEMVCEDSVITNVIKAMKKAHPYEEVAYEVYSMESY
jgi:hypothetical protein